MLFRKLSAAVCLCLLLCLAACAAVPAEPASAPAPAESSSPAPAATEEPPAETPPPTVMLAGQSYPLDTRELRLENPDADTLAALCAAAPDFRSLQTVALDGAVVTPEQLLALREAFPEAELRYTVSLFGGDYAWDTSVLDLSSLSCAELASGPLPQLRAILPMLEKIDLLGSGAQERDLDELSALRAAVPEEISIVCRFSLFDQVLDSGMEEIVYEKAGLKSEDLDTVRKALPLLSSCRRFVLDNCGPSYEALAKLRDEFPEKGVVWRVHLKQDSLLTDETVLWTIYIDDDNCKVLNYCTELEYIDLGHCDWFSDISFTAYMPKLKVLIIALTAVEDLSPLANCPELEYLEVFGSKVHDLSPLANCTKLEHLNIGTLFYLRDITPLYGLTNLKRLWMINSGGVPQAQRDEITRLLPDCEMRLFSAEDPTWYGWRKLPNGELDERYALLKEQIGYNGYNSPADKIDWDKSWKPGYAELSP